MAGVRYFDIRHVRGEVSHIDIENTRVESAGTTFLDRAIIRVLGAKGWGFLTVDHFERPRGRKFEELLGKAAALGSLTSEEVVLADVPAGMLPVPHRKVDPLDIDLDEKGRVLLEIEKAARLPGIASTRAGYTERYEDVRFEDSCGNEYSYSLVRSGYSILAIAERGGDMQIGSKRQHAIQDFPLYHRQEDGETAARRAIALLDARGARGGIMNAVLDPELAGVFCARGCRSRKRGRSRSRRGICAGRKGG